jgi:hypothetical protein
MTDEPIVLPADPDQPVPYTVDDNAGKDTRDGTQPPAGESTLSSAVLDLLTAIRDHVNVPLPSTDRADELAWQKLMQERLVKLHSSLSVALSEKWLDLFDLSGEAAYIRARTADTPVTYGLWEVAEPPPAACAACHRPFDPADTRWDGAARQRDTPFCRACVDRCHDSEIADHRCPVCRDGGR